MTRRIADRYLLGEQLGAGGSSRVHAALDERLNRRVAIKLLDSSRAATADPAGRERFLREGPNLASFSHRNAVTVFDAGEDAGDLYIVMELVEGPSLAQRLAANGPLAVDEATNIARQVLAALAAAHTAGIVHRDIKPANVLLGSNGEVKVADFGIAKRFDDLEDTVTTAGTVVGTPRYIAPEQARGGKLTPATDLYAVGVLLYEMLTGKLPPSIPQDVRTLRPEVTERLAAAIDRALAPKPQNRFASAAAMQAFLDDESVMATQVLRAPPPVVRSGDTQVMPPPRPAALAPPRPPSNRGRAVVASVVVVLAVIVVVALLSRQSTSSRLTTAPTDSTTSESAPASTVAVSEITISPPVDEIIPGFPRTDDIEVFLEQLEDDPDLVGERGEELAEKLRELLDKRGKKQRDAVESLREEMEKWVEDEELDPAIAEALDELLEPYGDD